MTASALSAPQPAKRARWRRVTYWVILILVFGVILLACLSGTLMSQVEHPQYTVVQSDGAIEVREYAPMIVAEVEVRGERMKALNEGFRRIADYIFGNNLSATKVPMNAPVTQQAGEKIPMTAPVSQMGGGGRWKVRFVMPRQYPLDTLPRPKNSDVHLIPIPARKFAAIRFSGRNTDANLDAHRHELEAYVAGHHLSVAGAPTAAFYNPPWTLPFLRRNEILVELR